MKRFAGLYQALDRSTGSLDKRAALVAYFREAPAHDAAWALWFLSGGKLRRIASGPELRAWLGEVTGHPEWLVEDSYQHVGDLAETLTLLVDEPTPDALVERALHDWVEQHLQPVAGASEETRRAAVVEGWRGLPEGERLVFNKLITGALRVGVSRRSVQQALAELGGLDIALIAQRMMGEWTPTPDTLASLLSRQLSDADRRQPYPFFLASPLQDEPSGLGPPGDWMLEWKWDGIRLQLLRRAGDVALWSRGEERLDGRFPEIERAAMALPDGCVLDGELVAWGDDAPAPFTRLQRRINRLKPSARLMDEVPVAVLVYDLLELDGEDLRGQPLHERRAALQALLDAHGGPELRLSPLLAPGDWVEAAALREDARERGVEGLMIKRRSGPYRQGRPRGDWWKWKVDPLTIDAVLIYAQAGHGRRSTLFTDYTFGLWDGESLVPVAKAYSGLDDAEIAKLDRWIRGNTIERFGPVRSVRAHHVFELGFEAVNRSTRHKSGIAVRFPRILRWRSDKPAAEADQLETLRELAR